MFAGSNCKIHFSFVSLLEFTSSDLLSRFCVNQKILYDLLFEHFSWSSHILSHKVNFHLNLKIKVSNEHLASFLFLIFERQLSYERDGAIATLVGDKIIKFFRWFRNYDGFIYSGWMKKWNGRQKFNFTIILKLLM